MKHNKTTNIGNLKATTSSGVIRMKNGNFIIISKKLRIGKKGEALKSMRGVIK